MLLFIFKIYRTLKRVVAARKYPHQLAWAVAFGVLLGIVPHGNLLALGTLLFIFCLKLNHSAMGLTAIASSFAATLLDPFSHWVGNQMLSDDRIHGAMQTAWTWPLMPWTDLNNTIVMGSFTIGVMSLIPIFMLTYPLFRLAASIGVDAVDDELLTNTDDVGRDLHLAPETEVDSIEFEAVAADWVPSGSAAAEFSNVQLVSAEQSADQLTAPPLVVQQNAKPEQSLDTGFDPWSGTLYQDKPLARVSGPLLVPSDTHPSDENSAVLFEPVEEESVGDTRPTPAETIPTVQTRIDILRTSPLEVAGQTSQPLNLVPPPRGKMTSANSTSANSTSAQTPSADPAAMDEALNYLLRQLRDQHTGEAA